MLARLPDMAASADILLGNLEDAIPADRKEAARAGLVRVGARDRPRCDAAVGAGERVGVAVGARRPDDIGDSRSGRRLDVVMVPKVEGPWDIHYVDRLLAQLEARAWLSRPMLIHAILETAQGVANVEEIALASPRMQGMSLGPADLAASRRMKTTRVGGGHPGYRVLARPFGRSRASVLSAGPLALHDRAHGRRVRGGGDLPVLRAVRGHSRPRGLRGPVPRGLPDGLRGGVVACTRARSRWPSGSSRLSLPRSRSRGGSWRRSRTAAAWGCSTARCRTTRPGSRRKVMVDLAELLARQGPGAGRGVRRKVVTKLVQFCCEVRVVP